MLIDDGRWTNQKQNMLISSIAIRNSKLRHS